MSILNWLMELSAEWKVALSLLTLLVLWSMADTIRR